MNYKKHTVFFGIFLVAILIGNVSWFGAKGSSHTASAVSDVPQVASRYHLRSRATRAFNRAAGLGQGDADRPTIQRNALTTEGRYLAVRYHGRNRTTQFFGLPAGSTSTGQKAHHLEQNTQPTRVLGTQLASRYHLRNRTARFFERATGLARVSHGKGTPSGEIHEAMTTDQQRLQLA